MGIGDDELDAGQAAGDRTAQERQPPGAVLGRGGSTSSDEKGSATSSMSTNMPYD
jgi:hypothetical protein